MLVRLSEVRMKALYPDAKDLNFDQYYLVDEKFRDGTVAITVFGPGTMNKYLIPNGDYMAKEDTNES